MGDLSTRSSGRAARWIRDYLQSHPEAGRRKVRRAMRTDGVRCPPQRFDRAWQKVRASMAGDRSAAEPMAAGAILLERFRGEGADRFRGTFEAVKQRLEQYANLIDLPALGRLGPAVDLGCGRGEWLEVLAEHGVDAYGIEADRKLAAACRRRGLDARAEDALVHLHRLPPRSMSLVSLIHVAEHLAFEELAAVLADAHRVLMPGGVLLVETPNPTNLIVGSSSFYDDPTHRRPIPPRLLGFMATASGFDRVEMHSLNSGTDRFTVPAALVDDGAMQRLVATLNDVLMGGRDTALIAAKAEEGERPE